MDFSVQSSSENIRKIEDIIDIQKANGNFSVRQVVFSLPAASSFADNSGGGSGAGLVRSLESGLADVKHCAGSKKKFKKQRSKKSPLPDVVSWPSDSDITVLRMKLCLPDGGSNGGGGGGAGKLKATTGEEVPGDGLHQPDSSSMVNLATLMLQSSSPSKHSLNIEEYLLPLTSWEQPAAASVPPPPPMLPPPPASQGGLELDVRTRENLNSKDSRLFSKTDTKSKVAKFIRLYFCPCCTCLYEIERMRDEPSASAYFTRRRSHSRAAATRPPLQ